MSSLFSNFQLTLVMHPGKITCHHLFRNCGLLHYIKNLLPLPCASQHEREQKYKTKTLVRFPENIFIDYVVV